MTRLRRSRYSLDLLKSFEVAARQMNFTRAASELSLTQSAISRAIKTLEQQLDRQLIVERVFPVGAPALLRRRPLANPGQLSRHVLLQFETYTSPGPWLDWTRWLDASALSGLVPAGVMRFSHYDQVVQAAVDGSGMALGRYPLIAEHLRDGRLVAPLGTDGVVAGSLQVFAARQSAASAAVKSFTRWLHLEARRDNRRRLPPTAS